MSIVFARRKRVSLYYCIVGLVLMAAALMAVSARDSSGVGLRAGMVMLTAGAAFLMPWQYAVPAALAIWLGPNYLRSISGDALFGTNMLLELPAILGICAFGIAVRSAVARLEEENLALGSAAEGVVDLATGVYEERSLRPSLQAELTRSMRFKRTFAFVLVGIDEKHSRFDFRDDADWQASYYATAALLRRTRSHIDRVFLHGQNGFALILPESGEREVTGLVRRLRKIATNVKPREGQPGGPLPVAFGATFFPASASTVEDLLRRAEIALRVATKNSNRLQLDGAEAPAMGDPAMLRQPDTDPASTFDAGELPANISDAWVAEPVQKQTSPPVALAFVPTTELVTAVLQEAGDAPERETPAVQPVAIAALSPDQLSDEELTQLLGRLDETLGLIRGLRAQAS
ncbi:MAG: GGDEF domain-containing protein [Dehalococcoidia bacterium]